MKKLIPIIAITVVIFMCACLFGKRAVIHFFDDGAPQPQVHSAVSDIRLKKGDFVFFGKYGEEERDLKGKSIGLEPELRDRCDAVSVQYPGRADNVFVSDSAAGLPHGHYHSRQKKQCPCYRPQRKTGNDKYYKHRSRNNSCFQDCYPLSLKVQIYHLI